MGPKRKADAPKGEVAQKKSKKHEDKETTGPNLVEEEGQQVEGKGKSSSNNKIANKTTTTSSKQAKAKGKGRESEIVTPAASPKPVVALETARPAVLPVQSKAQAGTPAKSLQSSEGGSKSSLVKFGVVLVLAVVARYFFFAPTAAPSAPPSTLPVAASRSGPNKTTSTSTTMATTTKFAAKVEAKPKPKPPPPLLPKDEPKSKSGASLPGTSSVSSSSSSSSSSAPEKTSATAEPQITTPPVLVNQQSNKSNTTTKPVAPSTATAGATKVTYGVRVAFGGWGQAANHEALITKDVAGIWTGSRMVSSRAGKTHGIQLTSPPARAKSSLVGALSNSLGILDVLPASISTVNRKFHVTRPPLAGDCYCMQASTTAPSLTISIRLYQATNVTKIALFHRGDDFATAIKRFSLLSWNKDPLEERSKAKPRSLGVFEWGAGSSSSAGTDELQAFDVTANRGAVAPSSSRALTLQIDSNQGGFGNKTCVYRIHVFSR